MADQRLRRGMTDAEYGRWRRSPEHVVPPCRSCAVRSYALGLCRMHYNRQRRNGVVSAVQRGRANVDGRAVFTLVEDTTPKRP